ncbi:MAG: hypothetical protein HYW70_03605 [Candidatus Nealsonbacteria bacterium]|nr:hypothetical protein [Candidatus Nealsonbacteria bacterium]
MDSEIKVKLEAHFTSGEIRRIEDFLNRGFSKDGQIVIASIFLFANENNKSVDEVLIECEKEWESNWQYQHPDIKGSADAPGHAGTQNRRSLANIYLALNIPNPLIQKMAEIPTKAIIVTTRNSVYRFGEANQKGERTVSRDGNPLDFTRCIIIYLSVSDGIEIKCLDGSHPGWYTTPVLSIK